MRVSCAENSLIFEWLALIRRQYRLYNVDNTHQCHSTATHALNLQTPEEEELYVRKRARLMPGVQPMVSHKTIIQPFEWAPHFYGCIVCGRYHICHRNERECEVILNPVDQQLTCRHSHQVLREATSYEVGNYEGEVQFEQESHQVDREIRMGNGGRTRREFRAAPRLYTNTRMKQPLCELEALEQLEKREVREEERRDVYRAKEKSGNYHYVQEEMEAEEVDNDNEMQVEENHQLKVRNWHDNRLYWNHYFEFLLEGPVLTPTTITVSKVVIPIKIQPLELAPCHTLTLDSESLQVISDTIEEVVTRLMKAQHRALKRVQPLHIDALNRQIGASLLQPVQRILTLSRHTVPPGGSSVRNACIALLLLGLTESFYGADSYRQRIEIWHRHPWLATLRTDGVTDQLFAPQRRKNHKPMDSVKKKQRYDAGLIKQAWSQTEQSLALYRHSHSLWMRRFVQS